MMIFSILADYDELAYMLASGKPFSNHATLESYGWEYLYTDVTRERNVFSY